MPGCQLGRAMLGSHGHTGMGARAGGSGLCQDRGHPEAVGLGLRNTGLSEHHRAVVWALTLPLPPSNSMKLRTWLMTVMTF